MSFSFKLRLQSMQNARVHKIVTFEIVFFLERAVVLGKQVSKPEVLDSSRS